MASAKTFNFTKTSINKLAPPDKGMATYRDSREKGLSLYVTAKGAITFFVRRRIEGKDERIILGPFPEITVENVRKLALKAKSDVVQGINPNAKKHKLKQEITFQELFLEYMERYSKKYKRSWRYDEREIKKFLPHWFKRKISTISKHEVMRLHDKIKQDNGLYQANRLLERIRAMFNKAIEWGWDGTNPAQGIKKFKEKSRDRFVQPDELPRLFEALDQEENTVARDYLWLALMTGARKSNLLAMRWEEINWELEEWRIPETKNGEPLSIPLTTRTLVILEGLKQAANSEWVFPSSKSRSGHLADPKKSWQRVLARAGIDNLRLHDIRRTIGSYQAITGASLPIIGKSLGHKSQQATQIYSRLNLDPVRASMEKATESMFGYAEGRGKK